MRVQSALKVTGGVVFVILLVGTGCISRYRLDLIMTAENQQRKVKVENTTLITGVQLADPFTDPKIKPGDGNCVVITTSSRGGQLETDFTQSLFLRLDENFRCKLYFELPFELKRDTIELKENSFVHILGRYEQSIEEKIFLASSGTLVVDSVVDQRTLYGDLTGAYENRQGQAIQYQGKFKVKIAN